MSTPVPTFPPEVRRSYTSVGWMLLNPMLGHLIINFPEQQAEKSKFCGSFFHSYLCRVPPRHGDVMKKIISLFLVLALSVSMIGTAFAATPSPTTILEDNAAVRIAQAVNGDERYVSTFDKINNTITTERYSISDRVLLATVTVDLNDETIKETDSNAGISIQAVVSSKYTDSVYGYEYTNDNPIEWKLTRAKYAGETNDAGYYFKTKQTSVNKSDLDSFRQAVNSIASAESELLALVGTTSFLAGFATGFTIGTGGSGFGVALAAYLAAAGFGLAAQEKSNKIGELQDNALTYYLNVKNESSIYF